MGARLIAETGAFEGAEYPLRSQGVVLGRLKSNDVEVRDTKASRRHTRVGVAGGRWIVEDLKSSNGTFLNGEKIDARVPLSNGDKISIGKTIYRFELDVEVQASAPAAGTRPTGARAKPRPAPGPAARPAPKPRPKPRPAPVEPDEPEELHLEEPEELGLDEPGAGPAAPAAPRAPAAPKPGPASGAPKPAISKQPLVSLASSGGGRRSGLLGGEIGQRDWRFQAVVYLVMALIFAAVVYGAFALTSGALDEPVQETPVAAPAPGGGG